MYVTYLKCSNFVLTSISHTSTNKSALQTITRQLVSKIIRRFLTRYLEHMFHGPKSKGQCHLETRYSSRAIISIYLPRQELKVD